MNNLRDLRLENIKKITSKIDIKVNIFIDGNNLYTNIDKDLSHILDIYKIAKETYELSLNTQEEEMYHFFDKGSDVNLDKTPDKLANLASWYLNTSLPDGIIKNLRAENASSLLGEIDKDKEKIIFPREVLNGAFWIDDTYVYFIEEYLKEGKNCWLLKRLDKKEKEDLFKVVINILNSINAYKNITTIKNLDILSDYLKENPKVKEEILIKMSTYDIERFRDKIFLEFDFQYKIYRAKIDIERYIKICQSRYSIPKLSSAQKNFYLENIKLLQENKLRPIFRENSYIVDINFQNEYYDLLEKQLKAETKFGQVNWNTFKIEEKEVDTNLTIDCLKSMMLNKADIHCILTNDSDYAPLFAEAKENNKELYLCTVVPQKTLSRRLKESVKKDHLFFVKHLSLDEMFNQIMPKESSTFNTIVTNEELRKKLLTKTIDKIEELQFVFKQIKNNYETLDMKIKNLIKERYE